MNHLAFQKVDGSGFFMGIGCLRARGEGRRQEALAFVQVRENRGENQGGTKQKSPARTNLRGTPKVQSMGAACGLDVDERERAQWGSPSGVNSAVRL